MQKVDYMRDSGVRCIPIKDRTKTKQGVPTFLAMERQLKKTIRYANM